MTSPPSDVPKAVVHRWPYVPESVPDARRALLAVLDGWGMHDLAHEAGLVLSELLTNAVVHVRGDQERIETRFERRPDGELHLEVDDAGAGMPLMHVPSDEAEGGRGLQLVNTFTAGQWGVIRHRSGKTVWARLSALP
ncbi:ATP-binding protein [Streptomyces sp. HPF1205]|uniref:ATP-binding protein n=1 Tax=Streptomyces sp. HPF1205 TaxID=2873262 RepID=UPI001CED55AE|nr:ATP-binding protein [Streptomyces sp. HPF1205]